MGAIVKPYRIAMEEEISRWNGLARALRKDDLEAFEGLMDICRNHAYESGNTANPAVFELMVMSILLAHQETLNGLETALSNACQKSARKKAIHLFKNPGEGEADMKSKIVSQP